MANRVMNSGVNETLETWITRGTPYLTITDSKFVKKFPTFPVAATETFEITQTNTSVTLSSASEENNDIVRRVTVSTETTGTLVCRDFKPELIEIANAGVTYQDASAAVTGTNTVAKLGEYFVIPGVAQKTGFTLKKASVDLEEGVHYVLSEGVYQVLKEQPVDGVEVGDVLTYAYTKKAQTRVEAGQVKDMFATLVFIGHRVTETENNLYKVTLNIQIDPSPFIGQSVEDFANSTFTFTVLRSGRGTGLTGLYTIELITEGDD